MASQLPSVSHHELNDKPLGGNDKPASISELSGIKRKSVTQNGKMSSISKLSGIKWSTKNSKR